MATERWQHIDQLFHAALERPAAGRHAFLDEACGGDEALRGELRSLLDAHEETGGFLDTPPADLAADWLTDRPPSLVGQQISHYQILSVLGKGGMGEVYLARDERLERQVALKLLPAKFTADADRVRRFVSEAKAASALNHPNIITIHEIGQTQTQVGELRFIVTEYIAGETLRENLRRIGLSLARALDAAVQIASALGTAHEAGIIHRDIKPENVMLRRDGYVKVLDFGLAKLTEKNPLAASVAAPGVERGGPSRTTASGTVMGTAHYMSPEQARGQKVDARTDMFSFGVMLYEMFSGRVPFDGVNAIEVMGAILNQEPPPPLPAHHAEMPADVARELNLIVTKALHKDREQRYQTIEDLLIDLRHVKHRLEFEIGPERPPPSARHERLTVSPQAVSTGETRLATRTSSTQVILNEVKRHKLVVALTLALAIVAVAIPVVMTYRALNRPANNASVTPLRAVPFSSLPGREDHLAFSPDGNQAAFVWDGGAGGQFDLYVKLIGVGAPVRLTNSPATETHPVWSPDARYIAFLRQGKGQDDVIIVPALGGPERRLCVVSATGYQIAWSPDGKWLVVGDKLAAGNTGLVRVAVEGGAKQGLTQPPPTFEDNQPAFSPDGRQLVFARKDRRTVSELYLVAADGGPVRQLTNGGGEGAIDGVDWTSDGQSLVYAATRNGKMTLWRVPLSGGEPTMLSGVGWNVFWPAVARRGNLLAYAEGYSDTSVQRLELPAPAPRANAPASAAPITLIDSKSADDSAQISPDGAKIAFVSDRSGSQEIWIGDRDGGNLRQLTQMRQAEPGSPRWSPDGGRIVFDAHPDQSGDLFVIKADGGAPQRLTTDLAHDVLPSWSHDGQWIYFCSNRGGDFQIWKMPSVGGDAVLMTRRGGFEAFESPDGQTIYYSKDRGVDGLWAVPTAGGAEQPVTELAQAGYWRAWAVTRNGIYYVAHTGAAAPYPLRFFSFATRQTTPLGKVDKAPPWFPASLTVAPDERWLFFTQLDQQVSTLMLVENFK